MEEKELHAKVEEMLGKQEQAALKMWKEEVKLEEARLPRDIKELLESAFLTGFNMGGLFEEQHAKEFYRINPVACITWLKDGK